MVAFLGRELSSVEDILAAALAHPEHMRMTYRVQYTVGDGDAGRGARLERPAALRGNDPRSAYPWEHVLLAAVHCAGPDYLMLAHHFGVPLERAAIRLDAVIDPRPQFAGLLPRAAMSTDSPASFQSFHWQATLTSPAPRSRLEPIHRRVLSHNMVMQALRAVPLRSRLTVRPARPAGDRGRGARSRPPIGCVKRFSGRAAVRAP